MTSRPDMFALRALDTMLLAAAMALAACTSDQSADRISADTIAVQEIEARAAIWPEAAEAGDVDRMVSLYAPGAVFLPPGSPPVKGRDRIADLFRQQFATFQVAVEFATDEIAVDRNLGYRRGSYRAELVERESGDTVVARDKFLEIWRRGDDGTWRITRDMWNALEPAAPASETGGRGR